MSNDKNNSIPVIIGVVGGSEELLSLKPVFDEFQLTFRKSTPIKIIQASKSDGVSLFDINNPALQVKIDVRAHNDKEGITDQDIATYLLRNCHFVLFAKTLKKSDLLRTSVQTFVTEMPANTPSSGTTHHSIFDLPDPCPVLAQIENNSLKFEIVKGNVVEHESKPEHHDKANSFFLPLFEHEQRKNGIRRVWSGLTGKPASSFHASSSEGAISVNHVDLLDKRWLDCLEGIHRQAEFNENSCQFKPDFYQAARFGYDKLEAVHDAIQPMFQIYCKADKLAIQYQMRWQQLRFTTVKNLDPQSTKESYSRRFISFFYMAVLSAFLLVFSTEFGELCGGWANPVSSLLYIVILVWCLKRYYHARAERWEQNHQDYRYIAEVLAVQIHWVQAGIKTYASNYFRNGVKNEVQWVRRVVHSARFMCKLDSLFEAYKAKILDNRCKIKPVDEVADSWIEKGQLAYHRDTLRARREGALHALKTKRRRWGYIFICFFSALLMLTCINTYKLLTEHPSHSHDIQQYMTLAQEPVAPVEVRKEPKEAVVAATVSARNDAHSSGVEGHDSEWWMEQGHHAVIVSMALSLVIFALLGEVVEGYALEQELTRSEELVAVYNRCMSEFKRESITCEEKCKLLTEVGRFAIEAETNWLIMHRERPMQPVKGG